ncbi:myomegalin isoform 5 [Mus musculus]|uniref:Phosphodiesterase 4D interacting protein (myomegalin) n=1 Tax=Mus musculus TaxID=10090 RepID=G3X9L9_MOUSE|nr:myomegalin isoform 5 [Mus musculus]EDL38942.1 phosphodiesterase 4D interacting protein (myomegalin), isoform CRA_a [Mus musculus]|eukprot:NP_001276630.1 myomegalin isoform 5 [Mus musculus]
MKRTDSGSICHHAPPPCWAHHAPRQSPRQPSSRERRPPERAGSWAVAAEEEEAASAAPWMRHYFGEDDGEMVPRTSSAAAFLSDTKDRGPPVQSQTWRSAERVPFGQAHSLRAFEKPPLVQTQALRDFEKHLNDLKKENFSLKLRIYFLEERMQQKYEVSREDVYKRNIELKVEVESLKRELQDRKQHLDKTWADAEDLNSQNEAELRRQVEERQQETEHVYELLGNKIQLLQEEPRLAKNEATEMETLVEAEKRCNLELSERWTNAAKNREDAAGDQEKPDQYSEALAQRDRRIEELRQSLAAQEGLVEQLSQEKRQLLHLLEEPASMEVQPVPKGLPTQQKPDLHETPTTQPPVSESHLAELQDKIQQTEATNKILQEKLNDLSCELKSAQESSQKQDTTIQSLKEMLKSRESETEELYQVIEGQNDTMAKLREMLHQSQLGQLHSSEGIAPAQQQVALLDLQSALFCSQLEIQRLQRLVRQKERQLADGKRCVQLVEAAAQEREHQKEAAWKHNQELRKALQHLQGELHSKSQQLHVLEAEKYNEIRTQGQNIQHLSHSLSHKEQLIQELQELLQYRDNADKTLDTNEVFLEKLRQRIQDRAVALERVIDEKFSALEEKDKELRQLRLAVRDRDHDLERLRCVLSANEATMQSMESLLRARGLEVEQLTATCQNLQWLKEELETKFGHWQKEQESIIQQLQTSLHDRNKEVEDLSATLLCKLGPGQSEVAEELCQRLQRKERMLQDLLSDRNKQAVEHEMEIQGLLQSMGTREQERQAAAEKMVQAFMERNSELQALRQYLGGKELMTSSQTFISNQPAGVTSIGPHHGEQTDQGSMQMPSRDDSTSLTAREEASIPRSTLGDSDTVAGLEKELSNAKEELELMAKKERESQMELSALQSMMAMQEEELQVQAADLESLTRNVQIKEDLIKDLQMQLVDPEDIPAMERLTQEVLLLREKVASVEPQGQEVSGNKRQQLLLMLEGLVDERSRLNEALQAERQLYSSLVKFHAQPENSERDGTLQVELEGAQVLRTRLEEVLGRSLERLSRLESLAAIGGATAGNETEDTSTEFTDSIEEEAAHTSHQQLIKVALEKSLATMETQNICLQPPSPVGEDSNRCLQEEMLHLRAEIHQHLEEKRKAEVELKELKAQIEEAGFSSVSHIRNTMLSLCLENAELKEQMGEAMSDGWEVEEDKEKGEVMLETVVAKGCLNENSLQAEFRKVQGKLKSAYNIINLLKEQLLLRSSEGNSKEMPELLVRLAREVDRMNTGLPSLGKHQHQEQENTTTARPGSRPQSLPLGAALSVDGYQLENKSQAQDSGHQPEFSLPGSTKHLRSQLAQCRQRYQDLQEKLLISEATVFAQANQLEKYRAVFSESLVKQDSKQIQVDLQDLGYETCGRSENEAEREETTSPECEEHNNLRPVVLMEGLCSEQGYLDPVLVSPPAKKPLENKPGKQEEFRAHGTPDDSSLLRKDIRDLKAQLQNANKVIQNLRSRVRSLSATSDYSSSLERPRKLRAVATLEGASPHSVTDEDEGWLSDGTGAFYPPGLQAKKDLESLIQRVSQLEAQLPKTGLEGKLAEELRCASWPGKYDSLIQDQARELSYLRQKIREGRGICYLLTQHAKDTVKSFEDLLRSNDIDYYLGQSFREQLAQGGQLTERLTSKLSTKDHKSEKEEAGLEPLALRLSRELQEKEKVIEVLQAKLDTRSLSPPSSHAVSDSHRSASTTSFLSDDIEACSDMDVASEYTHYDEKKPSPSHSDSIHLSSHSPVLSSNPSAASASQGLKGESSSSPISLPTPQNPPKEASQAHPGFHFHSIPKPASLSQTPMHSALPSFVPFSPSGPPLLGCCETPMVSLAEAQQELQMLQKQLGESVSIAPPASTSTLLSNQTEASSPHYINPAQPHTPTRSTIELGRILEPGYLGSSGQWDMMRPQKGSVSGELSSGSSMYQLNSKPTGADLLEEHLGEIRNLRQRLEESICVNDRLREQLQHRLSSTARENGSTSHFYSQGLESMPQLYNENRALREENQSLQTRLSHASRGHSQEVDHLREALLSSRSQLQELEKELEQQKAERQQLLEDLQEKQDEIVQFREERLSLQENNSRLQHKLALLQQQCEEKQQLSLSLQSELQIYESLCENPKKALKAFSLDSCHQVPGELSCLVAEIRALRGQLEQSIEVNNRLRLQLEQQMDRGAGKASLGPIAVGQSFPDKAEPANLHQGSAASPPVRDVGLNSPAMVLPNSSCSAPGSDHAIVTRTNNELSSDDSAAMKNPPKLEVDATDGPFANKHGRHVIGHVDDYDALQQQIGEGKLLIQKILSLMRSARSIPGQEAQDTEAPGNISAHELRSSAKALNHALEESTSLLNMFWRAALPNTHGPVLVGKEGQLMEKELLDLRAQVSQQEQILQNTAARLKRANQRKKSMEQFIVSHLTRTHDVLKKARTNLEMKSFRALTCTPAL